MTALPSTFRRIVTTPLLAFILGLLATTAAAAPITLAFSASGFQNGGAQFPGLDGPVSGSISWDGASTVDPVGALTNIGLTINGHTFGLGEVGIGAQTPTILVIGGLARGAGAVVGDGAFDDFLLVLNRSTPGLDSLAYSLAGRNAAIWWSPAQREAHYVETTDVPEPSVLALTTMGLLGVSARVRGRRARAS